MISSVELLAMQATATSAMDQTVTQKRMTQTQGPTKNVIETPNTLGTLSCNIAQPTAGMLANYEYKIGTQAAYLMRFPVGTDIRANDQFVTADGQILVVQVVLTPESYATAMQCIAAEVK